LYFFLKLLSISKISNFFSQPVILKQTSEHPIMLKTGLFRGCCRFFCVSFCFVTNTCSIYMYCVKHYHFDFKLPYLILIPGYHRLWNNAVSVRHPSLWTFIRYLKDQQAYLENSVQAVDRGEPAPKRKRKWRILEERMVRLKEEYNNGTRNIDQYWKAVCYGVVQFWHFVDASKLFSPE